MTPHHTVDVKKGKFKTYRVLIAEPGVSTDVPLALQGLGIDREYKKVLTIVENETQSGAKVGYAMMMFFFIAFAGAPPLMIATAGDGMDFKPQFVIVPMVCGICFMLSAVYASNARGRAMKSAKRLIKEINSRSNFKGRVQFSIQHSYHGAHFEVEYLVDGDASDDEEDRISPLTPFRNASAPMARDSMDMNMHSHHHNLAMSHHNHAHNMALGAAGVPGFGPSYGTI